MEIIYQPLEKNDYNNHDVNASEHPEIIRCDGHIKVKNYDNYDWRLEVVVSDRAVMFHFYDMGVAPWDECAFGFWADVKSKDNAKAVVRDLLIDNPNRCFIVQEFISLGFTRYDV